LRNDDLTCWREKILDVLKNTGEALEDIHFEPHDINLDKKFDDGYGTSEGVPFVGIGDTYVYFPVVYDGCEWVGCVPRKLGTKYKPVHWGGE